MSVADWVVLVAGVAAIAWVNWYFFVAEGRSAAAVEQSGGVQEITIAVEGGYDPATVRVKQGRPVRLVFDRRERSSCSEEVVIDAFGVRRFLPAFEKTTVEFTPAQRGTFDFTCGMGMLHGKLVVE
jgi:plastocyanin domain-containing protein